MAPAGPLPLRARIALGVVLVVCAAATIQLYGKKAERPVVEFQGTAMGTSWTVKLAGHPLAEEDQTTVAGAIEAAVARVDDRMSTWKPESELSRFNAHRSADGFRVSAETLAVIEVSQAVALRSGGAFDITIGPVVEAWGFGSQGAREPPTEASLTKLLANVGFEHLEVDSEQKRLSKRIPALRCDLSAVAKGFAVDEVARALTGLGYGNFLIEIGGELGAAGGHLDGRTWRVAIEDPGAIAQGGLRRSIHRVVELDDLSMATSGDYRNYFERDGKRFSHTIDPRTGRPIEHRLASVTVLHPEAVWADAWATALNVLGPEAGYDLASREGLAAYFILRSEADGGEAPEFEVRMTPDFEPKLLPEARAPDREP